MTGPITPRHTAAFAEYPFLRDLMTLTRRDGWKVAPYNGVLTIAIRVYGDTGYTDSLSIVGPTNAKAERIDPDGGLVWKLDGTAADAINGLLELPAPGEPGAPFLVIGRGAKRSDLWTP